MRAAFKVFTSVSRSEFAITENLIGGCLSFKWELLVKGAAVDEEGCFGYRGVSLENVMRT